MKGRLEGTAAAPHNWTGTFYTCTLGKAPAALGHPDAWADMAPSSEGSNGAIKAIIFDLDVSAKN